jgi:hypothetical protein
MEQWLTERTPPAETSGTAALERSRAFHHRYGFDEEARFRDYKALTL